jgi:glucose-6-phosphate-specific signal transduction histidine kinase
VANAERLVNIATLMALGFLALTIIAYLDHEYALASFYLLMAGGLLLSQTVHIAPRNKAVRLGADLGIILLALNTLAHYNYKLDNTYSVMALVVLVAAIVEAIYVAKKL